MSAGDSGLGTEGGNHLHSRRLLIPVASAYCTAARAAVRRVLVEPTGGVELNKLAESCGVLDFRIVILFDMFDAPILFINVTIIVNYFHDLVALCVSRTQFLDAKKTF